MKTVFSAAMRHATRLTRAQNIIEATRVIQQALSRRARDAFRRTNRRPKALD